MGKPDETIFVMGETPRTSRVFIVSQTSLFAQGIRSLLRGSRSIEIIGLESDPSKAIKAVRALQPNVVIVETSLGAKEQSILQAVLHSPTPMRLVALDLEHNHAMVCDPHPVVTTRAKDLVKAIRGAPRPREPVPLAQRSPPDCARARVARAKPPPRRPRLRQRAGP